MENLTKNDTKWYWKVKQALKADGFDEIKFMNWLTKRFFIEITPEGKKSIHWSCINDAAAFMVFRHQQSFTHIGKKIINL